MALLGGKLHEERRRLGAARKPKLAQGIAQVVLNGLVAQSRVEADLLVRLVLNDQTSTRFSWDDRVGRSASPVGPAGILTGSKTRRAMAESRMDWPVGVIERVDQAGSDREAFRVEPLRGGRDPRRRLGSHGGNLASGDHRIGDSVEVLGRIEDATAGEGERDHAGPKIYTDKASGSKVARPCLEKCLQALHPGDTLLVWRLDRLGRSMRHLIDLAEFERDLIRGRTKAGLTAARARGWNGGRPPIPVDHSSVVAAKKMHANETMPVADICRTLRISRPTLYRYLALT